MASGRDDPGDRLTTLEHGDIQFFYRPSVQAADADAYTLGVQSFFAILSAAGGSHRRLRIGRKRMPSRPKDRFWCRIERVGDLDRVLGRMLEPERYTTKTRGERYQPEARPVALGEYAFAQHGDHVHFSYRVEPFAFEDNPDELMMPGEGNHVVLFEASEGRAIWTAKGNLAAIDDEGAELVLVGSCASEETP